MPSDNSGWDDITLVNRFRRAATSFEREADALDAGGPSREGRGGSSISAAFAGAVCRVFKSEFPSSTGWILGVLWAAIWLASMLDAPNAEPGEEAARLTE